MTALGKRLLQSANEAVGMARGKADPATYKVFSLRMWTWRASVAACG
jgi:hypothetical protein